MRKWVKLKLKLKVPCFSGAEIGSAHALVIQLIKACSDHEDRLGCQV